MATVSLDWTGPLACPTHGVVGRVLVEGGDVARCSDCRAPLERYDGPCVTTIAASQDPTTGVVIPGVRIERDADGITRRTEIGMQGEALGETIIVEEGY